MLLCGRVGDSWKNRGSYSGRGGESGGGLSLIYGVLREMGLASSTTRCKAQEYKLLPLPLQGLYRGLQGHYSALQGFSVLAMCIYGVFYGFFRRVSACVMGIMGLLQHCKVAK